jgi:hypothetical protein
MFMKYTFLLCFWSIISVSAMGQTNDQKDVSDAVGKLHKAMIAADRATLEQMTSDSLSYGHSNGWVHDKKEFVDAIASGRSVFVTIDISEQTISILHNIAIVRHIFNARTNDSGIPAVKKLKILLVWEKENGAWKLLARQAVKLP